MKTCWSKYYLVEYSHYGSLKVKCRKFYSLDRAVEFSRKWWLDCAELHVMWMSTPLSYTITLDEPDNAPEDVVKSTNFETLDTLL